MSVKKTGESRSYQPGDLAQRAENARALSMPRGHGWCSVEPFADLASDEFVRSLEKTEKKIDRALAKMPKWDGKFPAKKEGKK